MKAEREGRSKFDESVDVCVALALDPRKPNQSIRKALQMPHGTGKTLRIAVFAKGADADSAEAAGADLVGAEDLVEDISKGTIDFDRAIATPDMMAVVGRVARVLGPRGLMPNPKLGTVTKDVSGAVAAAKKGQVEFRTEKNGLIHAPIGRLSFDDEKLADNLKAIMLALVENKPDGAPKGKYILDATLSSTQSKGHRMSVPHIDPGRPTFMREMREE
jgi:large subunit ribosomal protein L1